MVTERSAWRVGDAAAYERAITLADDLISQLMSDARARPTAGLAEEATILRKAATGLDGFDRSAIDAFSDTVSARLNTVRGEA